MGRVWLSCDDDSDDDSDDNEDIATNDSSLVKEACSENENASDIASDIHSLSDCGLLQGEIKDKLNELQKSLVAKKSVATHFSSKLWLAVEIAPTKLDHAVWLQDHCELELVLPHWNAQYCLCVGGH